MAQPTQTELDNLIVMLKYNLEIITDYMDAVSKTAIEEQLKQYILSGVEYAQRQGIDLNYSLYGDNMIVVMYAGYLYDKRKDASTPYPRMLRCELNNRIFSGKVNS